MDTEQHLDARRIACFFSTSGHSGVDRLARHLLPAMAARGYRVDLLKVRNHGPHLEAMAGALPNMHVVDLGSRHTYGCVPGLRRYLRHARPAVILADKDRVNRTALLAKMLSGVPSRLYFSSGTTLSVDLAHRSPLERWLQHWSVSSLYRHAAGIIVLSRGSADDLQRCAGLHSALIKLVPAPVVPENLFEQPPPPPDHPWFQARDKPVILGVGELSRRKDPATLLRAFAQLRGQRPCRLMILGRGSERTALLALAAQLGVADDFALPGFVPNPYPYLAHADVFAFASRWEGLGFVIIEALALGTPVVSTDCPSGPREVLQDGRYGRLVAVGDAAAMATALAATLDAPPAASLLREAARPYAIEAATGAYLAAMGLPPSTR